MIGVSTVVVALSSTAAPIVAVELYNIDRWASIFVLDIVLALVAFILIFRGLPAKSAPSTLFCFRTDFLWSGTALVMSSIFIVIGWRGYVESKRSILIVLGFLVCCLLCWVVFKKQAMVSLTCSVGRSSLWCWIVSVLAYAGQASSLVALPFLISGQSESGINEIGWQLALWSGCSGITGPLASYFFNVGRMSAVGLLLSGLVLMFSGMALLASLGMLSLPDAVPVCMVLSGAGFGLFQISNILILMKSTPLHYSARINSYIAVGRCFGQMVGVATASALFSLDLPSVEFRIFRYSAALVLIALVLAMVSGLNSYPRKK
ncbi:hypothetical protein [Pseudomonas syringae]|uniref:hypothetical protein n=1 Tax=Pseudomonas syringae TaxID=317 RepID=UPI0012AEBE67|nr:hypothetical protein [Pseudomonas syringae]